MRTSLAIPWLGLCAALTLASAGNAQVTKASKSIEEIDSLQDDVSPDKSKDELVKLALEIREQCADIHDAIGGCGEGLAEDDGPYEDERQRFRAKVEHVIKEMWELDREAEKLTRDVSSDRCTDTRLKAKYLISVWGELNKQIDETRKFLTQGLNTANTLRNDIGKAGELKEQQEQEAKKREDEAKSKKKALISKWYECIEKSYNADAKQKDAYAIWRDFLKGGGDTFSPKGLDLAFNWNKAVDELKEAKGKEFEVFVEMDESAKDVLEFYKERAKAAEELDQFIEDITENSANRAWSQFDAWLKMFEKDVSG